MKYKRGVRWYNSSNRVYIVMQINYVFINITINNKNGKIGGYKIIMNINKEVLIEKELYSKW